MPAREVCDWIAAIYIMINDLKVDSPTSPLADTDTTRRASTVPSMLRRILRSVRSRVYIPDMFSSGVVWINVSINCKSVPDQRAANLMISLPTL